MHTSGSALRRLSFGLFGYFQSSRHAGNSAGAGSKPFCPMEAFGSAFANDDCGVSV